MRQTLSDKGVAALKPRPRRYAYPDPELRGLWIRVQPTGAKSYAVIARSPDGKQLWTTIAPTDATPIARARAEARAILERVRAGLPPVEPKGETFAAVADNWLKRRVDANGFRSAREIRRLLAVHVLPVWKDRAFVSIRRSDVTALLDHVEDEHSPRQADQALNVIRAIMVWRASRSDDYSPPIVRGMKRDRAAPRQRVLDDGEVRAVWQAAGTVGVFGSFILMCLLTAQRSRKVAAMKWADIEDGVWTVPVEPREKAAGGALVLSALALDILAELPRFASNPHVFAGRDGGPWRGFSRSKRTLNARLPKDMPRWTLHDLRRTARSLMARAGAPGEHAERVLGHSIKGVEGIYNRHHYRAEKAEALARLARLVDEILHPRPSDVVTLTPKARRR